MLSCRCKDGTGQGERVDFDELGLLDGKVCEELSVSADVVSGRAGNMEGVVAFFLEDEVPVEEASVCEK